jgi:hypothetical protein
VENVEIMGIPLIITWKWGQDRQMQSMQSGTFAKLPREILDRFDEFKNTTVLTFDDIHELEAKAEKLVIPEPRRLSVPRVKGSMLDHPIPNEEIEAMNGQYVDFARSWVTEPLGTSSRARVDAQDVAIGLAIVKVCSRKMNADGTMPTNRIKAIWDKLFENEEVDRGFDYHRWRVTRNLIEVQGGLEMVDRKFYTGFVGSNGQLVPGRAAEWHMAEWLVEKLDEIADTGYQVDELGCRDVDLMPCHAQGGSLLKQETENSLSLASSEHQGGSLLEQEQEPDPDLKSSSLDHQGGSLLEQQDEEDLEDLFDKNWIIEFRRSEPPLVGLIWGGSVQNIRREAG